MRDTTRAYIAGFFDGDGCVDLRNGSSPQLNITQKDRIVLDWIAYTVGYGKVYPQGYCWALKFTNRRDVQDFIRMIYPYSVVKKSQLKKAYHYEYRKTYQTMMEGR